MILYHLHRVVWLQILASLVPTAASPADFHGSSQPPREYAMGVDKDIQDLRASTEKTPFLYANSRNRGAEGGAARSRV